MKPNPIECIHHCTGAPIDQLLYLFKTLEIKDFLMEIDIMKLSAYGIPIFNLFADHFGCHISEVKLMARDHVVRYADFESVINNLTSEGGLMYLEYRPEA